MKNLQESLKNFIRNQRTWGGRGRKKGVESRNQGQKVKCNRVPTTFFENISGAHLLPKLHGKRGGLGKTHRKGEGHISSTGEQREGLPRREGTSF